MDRSKPESSLRREAAFRVALAWHRADGTSAYRDPETVLELADGLEKAIAVVARPPLERLMAA